MKKLLAVLSVFVLFSCGQPPLKQPSPYTITAHTSGAVSRAQTIRIEFSKAVGNSSDRPSSAVLTFWPPLSGKISWSKPEVLEFKPDSPLPYGTQFRASFHAEQIPGLSVKESFDFDFFAIKPTLTMNFGTPRAGTGQQSDVLQVEGTAALSDGDDFKSLEKVLRVESGEVKATVEWFHDKAKNSHRFVVSGIPRTSKPYSVRFVWDGSPVQSLDHGVQSFEIPAKDDFKLVSVQPVHSGEDFIELTFSDPLDSRQDLKGLIRVDDRNDLRFEVDRNKVRMYSLAPWAPKALKVTVGEGIKSIAQKRLVSVTQRSVEFNDNLPEVRFVGKGVIIPSTQGLTVPFETMNLSGIVVEALQVYGTNVPQFLQVNNLEGHNEMHRVGKVVWRQMISLDYKPDQKNRWVRRGLDMTKLIKAHPDGLFRLKLTFVKSQIVFDGTDQFTDSQYWPNGEKSFDPYFEDRNEGPKEASAWDYWENSYKGDDWYQNYRNPFHPAFYSRYYDHDIRVYRNVLMSNLGLTAKWGTDGTLKVFAADLRTADPSSGTTVKILDFQQQVMANGSTDGSGMYSVKLSDSPSFIVATTSDGQNGYLRLDEASALSVSQFDVSGEVNEKGLQGFIYGERGVWRPGDALYLTFILLDPNQTLPANYPVTMEVLNANGQFHSKLTQVQSVNGFYAFKVQTSPDDPTGAWKARIRIGNALFEKDLKVETIMPNRLKIALELKSRGLSIGTEPFDGKLAVRWLHGAKSPGLKTEIKANFSSIPTTFSRYSDYLFEDPTKSFSGGSQTLFDGNLDNDGNASFSTRFEPGDSAPGKLRATLTTKVFEESGAYSVEYSDTEFNPYDRYVGIQAPKGDAARGMLLTDTDHTLKIALLDKDGYPVSGNVHAELLKINWRWWWEKGPENLSQYSEDQSYRSIMAGDVQVKNGYAEWKFRLAYPDWGRFMLRVSDRNGGHSAAKIVYIDWPGWAGRAQKDGAGGANMLVLTSDKMKYDTGDKVTVSFPSNEKARALLTIEAGGKIVSANWVPTTKGTTVYTFTATPEMSPNAYVHVSLLQPHLQTLNDLPIRLYGIIPITVNNPASFLKPVIKTDTVYRPGQSYEVHVTEESGRPMTYTLAMVDEGLLGLTNFQTPNPWPTFYKRLASLIKTWDLYDFVAGAYSGQLENLLAIGGDGEAPPNAGKVSRFQPVVQFIGPVTLSAKGENVHVVKIPQYVGEVRIMVVAGNQKSFGSANQSIQVKGDLMTLATLPRVLGPGEELKVPVTVFAFDPATKFVQVNLQVTGPASIENAETKTVNFTAVGEKTTFFDVKVGDAIQPLHFKVTATAGTATFIQNIDVPVRVPSAPVYSVVPITLKPGESWKDEVKFDGYAGTNKLHLELSATPPIDLGRRLQYLIHYPYGCIEQTTSSVFPQLFLNKVQMLTKDEDAAIQTNIKAGLDRLKLFQTASGGFSYWPGELAPNPWGTNYAGNFILEADRQGYALPPGMLDKWKAYQKKTSNEWDGGENGAFLDQAYRLYTLALCGSPEIGAMNRLKEKPLGSAARWRLAAAYQLTGSGDVARQLAASADLKIQPYTELDGNFGSDLRDKAMILESLMVMQQPSQAFSLVQDISTGLQSENGWSTQTVAYALLAYSRYADYVGTKSPQQVTYKWQNGASKVLVTTKPVVSENLPVGETSSGTLTITNSGSGTVLPRLLKEGVPTAGNESAKSNGLQLDVEYTVDGKSVSPFNLPQGSAIEVTVRVQNTTSRELRNLVLNYLAPSGWELENERLGGSDVRDARYQDIRDDRIYTYFDLGSRELKSFVFKATASYLGVYYHPIVTAGAMYDSAVQAVVEGRWVQVSDLTK